MSTVLNGLYVAATLLFLAMVYIQTLREPPAAGVRDGWPMRRFWISDGLRHLTLALALFSAALAVFVVFAGATGMDVEIFVPALMIGGMALVAFGLAGLAYSLLLYRVSRADREGF